MMRPTPATVPPPRLPPPPSCAYRVDDGVITISLDDGDTWVRPSFEQLHTIAIEMNEARQQFMGRAIEWERAYVAQWRWAELLDKILLRAGLEAELRAELEQKAEQLQKETRDLLAEVASDSRYRRRHPTAKTKRAHLAVVARHFDGMCACCRKVKILNDDGKPIEAVCRFDHWTHRSCNRAEAIWPVCVGCNDKLEDPSYRAMHRGQFDYFQGMRGQPSPDSPRYLFDGT